MMRILYINPIGEGVFDRHFADLLGKGAGPGTEVTAVHLNLPESQAGPFLPSRPDYQGELFRTIRWGQEAGFDVVIVGCCSDPGYRSAKRAATIPVLFPLETGLHVAVLLAERVAVITPGPLSEVTWIEDSAQHYGLEAKIASILIASVPYPPHDELRRIWADAPHCVAEAILEAHWASIDADVLVKGQMAVQQKGAGALFLACTFWGGMAARLEGKLGIPVIDPVLEPLAVAELLARRSGQRGTG